MRHLTTRRGALLAALTLVCLTATIAAAGQSDRDKFIRKYTKNVIGAPGKSKIPCMCFDSTFSRIGELRPLLLNDQVVVECALPIFDNAGTRIATDYCSDYVPLTK